MHYGVEQKGQGMDQVDLTSIEPFNQPACIQDRCSVRRNTDGPSYAERYQHVSEKRIKSRRNELADAITGSNTEGIYLPVYEVREALQSADDSFRRTGGTGRVIDITHVLWPSRNCWS